MKWGLIFRRRNKTGAVKAWGTAEGRGAAKLWGPAELRAATNRWEPAKRGGSARRRRLSAILLACAIFLSACSPADFIPESWLSGLRDIAGGDGPGRGTGPGVAAVTRGGEPDEYTCDDVSLENESGRPTNVVGLGAVPSDFGGVPAFKVVDPATDDFVIMPVDGAAGRTGAKFIVPIHLNGSPEGGAVTLTLFDGEGEQCDPLDFTIEPLPRAPGAFREFVRVIGRAYDGTRQMFPPAPDEDSPMTAPFDIAEDRLRGPENPNSLEKIVAGTSDLDLTPDEERLMDGLVEESDLIDAWEQ